MKCFILVVMLTSRLGLSQLLDIQNNSPKIRQMAFRGVSASGSTVLHTVVFPRQTLRTVDHRLPEKCWKLSCTKQRKDFLSGRLLPARQLFVNCGGPAPIKDLSDPALLDAASFALTTLDAFDEDDNKRVFSKVHSATKKVVSGILYNMEISIFMTSCSESSTDCQPQPGDEEYICKLSIWSQPWLDEKLKLTESNCVPASKAPGKSRKNKQGGGKKEKGIKKMDDDNDGKLHAKLRKQFKSFVAEHKKVYGSRSELQTRFEIYKKNQKIIRRLQKEEQGTAKYGDTFFADMTSEEFVNHKGLNLSLKRTDVKLNAAQIPRDVIPEAFDWRNHSAVTPVKNQGSCGSCWAFSVTGNLEGLYAIKHGELLSLSEQELVDCDKLDAGCNGGLPENAYKALEELGGIETEEDYPYKVMKFSKPVNISAADKGRGQQCAIDSSEQVVKVADFLEISKDEQEIAQWLVKNGPVSVGINANAMQFYRRGVSHPMKVLCNPKSLDHGVLIVGYGTEVSPAKKKVLPYWIVKNSWGTRWGEEGYYRIYRGDGTCGINTMVTSAVVE